ncbi:MAG: sulfate ABC transporter substrate-binding protein [Planctomycetia bacterium]|nr:sulfate ABC transporter substrate-binding protein [Planctomycetia bacterium]
MKRNFVLGLTLLTLLAVVNTGCNTSDPNEAGAGSGKTRHFLNVSYDPTRELYAEYNTLFVDHWRQKTGEIIECEKSNGGSRAQARAVQSGMEADVVTLALAMDIDEIAKSKGGRPGLLPSDWQKRLPNNSCPYNSTIVFLVRKGNPKGIHDWDDLTKEGVKIVTPNPKTSGGACWNYLAAWGFALNRELKDVGGLAALADPDKSEQVAKAQKAAYDFTKSVFKNALAQGMPGGARDATDAFVKHGNGDVFLAWENEAILSQQAKADEGFEIVVPSISIKAEPPVAVVDANVLRHNTSDIAEEYVNYLYDPAVQEVIAKHHFRPSNPDVAAKYEQKYPPLTVFSVDEIFGGWTQAQREHFNSDANFDKMLVELNQ